MVNKKCLAGIWALCLTGIFCGAAFGFEGYIGITNGYFYDTTTGEAWVPHGIAYQTWNRPLGVWQTDEQINYDLDEIVKMGANSVRIDMVWQHIEGDGAGSVAEGDNQFNWELYDDFVDACEERGLRIFALIGYQWPPNWFPDEWYTMHPPEWDSEGIWHEDRWQSDIINYEHPDARAQYAEWLGAVAGHFKDSKAIAGWIVGNESGYLGLWSGLLDGYDPETEQGFRVWCETKYSTIEAANAVWGTAFGAFTNVVFPDQYRAYGPEGAVWADAVQFREDSIADFTAVGAIGARLANTNHLISYSTVGMQWGEEDWRYHAEDRGKITKECALRGAPIDFFSVNNYPWSVLGHEAQNGQWGVSYTKKVAQVPVLYSETGFTSSETMWPGMNEDRQGPLIRNALWESLEAGAIGTHIFSWMDRPWITDREKGFGIVYSDRRIKPAFWESRKVFNLMDQVNIHDLLMGSEDPTPDIAFLWTDANDSQHNRYECEMQQVAGALERLGYEPNFIDLQELGDGVYSNFSLIILPRNMRVEDRVPGHTNSVLNFLLNRVIPAGVHVMATADLPGLQNPNGNPRAEFADELNALFGIDATDIGGFEAPMRRNEYVSWHWKLIEVDFNANSPIDGYHCWPQVWKYSDEIEVTDGTVWATMDSGWNKGFEDSDTEVAKWDKTWGEVHVRSDWSWVFDGRNMVQMWGDAGMWYDRDVVPFGRYTHSAWLRSNAGDPLSGGREALLEIEWYDKSTNLLGTAESAVLSTATPGDSWVKYTVDATAPSNTWFARRLVRVRETGVGPHSGAVYVDHKASSPALVVKDHGAAKAGIFLFSAGDQRPDGDLDGDPDTYAWLWRYDYFGALVRDGFGIQPQVTVSGPEAWLCLPEHRTCADGSTLWQIKNYQYDEGDPVQSFTISSDLFVGKTIRALQDGRIIEENSDGTIELQLPGDGMEMLHVYTSVANDYIVQMEDVPSLVRPTGDKAYQYFVRYDCRSASDLTLKLAFCEKEDNGDGTPYEVYQSVEAAVSGQGVYSNYIWIPDADSTDADYLSSEDGGEYVFRAWLENGSSSVVAEAVPQDVQLKWGVRPTGSFPSSIEKGTNVEVGIEWEDLYEYLPWENTPLARNEAFPARVAVFRSSKTEALFPGHFDQVNAVCDWLESLGYANGNKLDLSFDNLTVDGLYSEDFSGALPVDMSRDAGCGNWAVDAGALRASRIGNDDNICSFGDDSWTDYTASVDIRYNSRGYYTDDAELYLRYLDRNNFVKVGIRNYYGNWRLKYTVRCETNTVDQNWVHNFAKTNSPLENQWYNLKVTASGDVYTVYFTDAHGEFTAGAFTNALFSHGKIALGSMATQLGIWEAHKGYFFIDDDEYSYYSSDESEFVTLGKPLNLDWGYLVSFYPTLILPGTYVMSDIEVSNVTNWFARGMRSLIATDGGVAMLNEQGEPDAGRIESLFGVTGDPGTLSGLQTLTIGTNDHYIALDYDAGEVETISGSAHAWPTLDGGIDLAQVASASTSAPAFIACTDLHDLDAPNKAVCFNFDAAAGGQLTNTLSTLAQRAFEWVRGESYRVIFQLKYQVDAENPDGDLAVITLKGWLLSSSGTMTLSMDIPEEGIMTGPNMYWVLYIYPREAEDAWLDHRGFYVSSNDGEIGVYSTVDGQGLQILGGATKVFAGRAWDLFVAYNTEGESLVARHGLRKKGGTLPEDYISSALFEFNGVSVPTSTVPDYMSWAPDFDPGMPDYVSTSKGGDYQWYIETTNGALSAYIDAQIYEAPRLMTEEPAFPKTMAQGRLVQVPVTWEELTGSNMCPASLTIKLENAFAGETYLEENFLITNSAGTQSFPVVVPTNIPVSDGYLWTAFITATNATEPWEGRFGADETFRFDDAGLPVGPETTITVSSVSGNSLVTYADIGIPLGCEIMSWSHLGGASFNGDYTNQVPPEGEKSFMTTWTSWAGWGVYMLDGSINMSAYAGGNLKFWLRSSGQVEIALEDALGGNQAKFLPTTTNTWLEVTIPIDSFNTIDLSQVYFLFKATQTGTGSFYVDYVRWELDPTLNLAPTISLPGPHIVLVGSTTNFNVTAVDPEGFPVTLANTVSPAGASFAGGVFTWTAPASACGTTSIVTFVADDLQGGTNSVVTNNTQIVVPWDGDEDGLQDGWEWIAFTSLVYNADEDNDGDGANNLNEYQAGTDPWSAGSLFASEITSDPAQPGEVFSIHISTVPGKKYTIYYSDDRLIDGMTWHPFANSANGIGTWSETDSVEGSFTFVDDRSADTTGGAPADGCRFFRVKVQAQ